MIYVFLANGFEEIEALTPIDVLRRGGVQVVTVGIGGKIITGSHKITVAADIEDKELAGFEGAEAVVLPGGMPGTLNLEKSPLVQQAVAYCAENDKFIGAICAAPSILGHAGLLKGKKAVCYPSFEGELEGAVIPDDFVCRDGKIITAKGMGVSLEFGLELLKAVRDEAASEKVRTSVQCR